MIRLVKEGKDIKVKEADALFSGFTLLIIK